MSQINGFVRRRYFLKLAGAGSIGMVASVTGCDLSANIEQAIAPQTTLADAVTANRIPVNPENLLFVKFALSQIR
ncbi:twin-arginine translocation pathway signal [Fischerella sp. NIES-4106]|jgi:carbonic anhydrase|nr:twin-arginine translocation pathway signal [Fischerella sp. NIES-4106]